jgi:nicotinate-nucleotide pyrophosphorylase (carboxylating)
VLIKDNHLAALGLTKAVERAKARWPMRIVEVECDTLEQVGEARDAGVDVVLLDNMTPEEVAEAIEILEGAAKTEISGRVPLDAVGAYAEAGADFISVGALTHSVRVFDIGLDIR